MKFFASEAAPPFEKVALTSHHEVAHYHPIEEEEEVAHAHPFEEEEALCDGGLVWRPQCGGGLAWRPARRRACMVEASARRMARGHERSGRTERRWKSAGVEDGWRVRVERRGGWEQRRKSAGGRRAWAEQWGGKN
jgi:hypothetical protein